MQLIYTFNTILVITIVIKIILPGNNIFILINKYFLSNMPNKTFTHTRMFSDYLTSWD